MIGNRLYPASAHLSRTSDTRVTPAKRTISAGEARPFFYRQAARRWPWSAQLWKATVRIAARPGTSRSGIHRVEELGVVLRVLQLVDQKLEPVDGAHRHQHAAQHPHLRQHAAFDQQFPLGGPPLGYVEGREGALVGDLGVEHVFRITGALELFEDHLVHPRAGVD